MAITSMCILEELRHVEMLKEESIRAYDVYKIVSLSLRLNRLLIVKNKY